MSNYQLIAFDMDGTLLNSEKKLTRDTLVAIEEAFAAGKEVVLSTGRSIAELQEFKEQIPGLRYLVCTSGAIVYDWKKEKILYSRKMSVEDARKLLEISKQEDTMIQILGIKSVLEGEKIAQMEKYHMAQYQPTYERITTRVDNIYDYFESLGTGAEKINLYHTSPECRMRSRERLKNLDIEKVDSEITSLECSAKGVTKGEGLRKLCEYLNIPLEATIAVGDADNDIPVLQIAGFSIAMENANARVKEICDVIVPDCDHDGCAEAIRKYLL